MTEERTRKWIETGEGCTLGNRRSRGWRFQKNLGRNFATDSTDPLISKDGENECSFMNMQRFKVLEGEPRGCKRRWEANFEMDSFGKREICNCFAVILTMQVK